MSSPFIIWTMQRTGGTSLAELLMEMSEHTSAEHEPFNWGNKNPRQFAPISEAWNVSGDSQQLRQSLTGIFKENFLIKHCYELFNVTFNMHLIHVSSGTPYRHIVLRRRDEASRLISKFIAEAEGTWFKDYARQVFSEVALGERLIKELPLDRIIRHYRHCQNSTKFTTDTLQAMSMPLQTVFFEDLYSGERATRMKKANELFDFLEFSKLDVQKHTALIDEKIFNSGQNTSHIANGIPNYKEVLQALHAEGCDVGANVLTERAATADPAEVSIPARVSRQKPQSVVRPAFSRELSNSRARIVHECVTLANRHGARAPFLEIANLPVKCPVLADAYFASQERHVLSGTEAAAIDGLAMRKGNPNDMKELYPDNHFGTVLWVDSLATDARFWRTLDEIRRVLRPGGVLIAVTSSFGKAGQCGFVVTGAKGNEIPRAAITQGVQTSSDYWRVSPESMRKVILEGLDAKEVRVMMVPPRIFGIATKLPDLSAEVLTPSAKVVES